MSYNRNLAPPFHEIINYLCNYLCTRSQGCRKRGAVGGHAPHKIWTRGEKRPHFLASFGLSAIKQYFLVTLFPHMVNLPAYSKFPMRSHTVITTNCSEKNKFYSVQLCHLQLSYLQCSLTICS